MTDDQILDLIIAEKKKGSIVISGYDEIDIIDKETQDKLKIARELEANK